MGSEQREQDAAALVRERGTNLARLEFGLMGCCQRYNGSFWGHGGVRVNCFAGHGRNSGRQLSDCCGHVCNRIGQAVTGLEHMGKRGFDVRPVVNMGEVEGGVLHQ